MKKKIIYTLILLVAIMLQTSVLPVFSNAYSLGDVVLMAVLAWAVLDGFNAFFGWAVVAGIFYDAATYSPIGEHVLIFLIIVYLVSFFSKRLSLEHKGIGFFLLFFSVIVATLFSESIMMIVSAQEVQNFNGYWRKFGDFGSMIFKIINNEIMFFVWFFLLKEIKKFFKIEN